MQTDLRKVHASYDAVSTVENAVLDRLRVTSDDDAFKERAPGRETVVGREAPHSSTGTSLKLHALPSPRLLAFPLGPIVFLAARLAGSLPTIISPLLIAAAVLFPCHHAHHAHRRSLCALPQNGKTSAVSA